MLPAKVVALVQVLASAHTSLHSFTRRSPAKPWPAAGAAPLISQTSQLMVGGVEAHEDFLIVTHAPASTYAGVECEHTTRSSFIHSHQSTALLILILLLSVAHRVQQKILVASLSCC
jgi:hypothetical protein